MGSMRSCPKTYWSLLNSYSRVASEHRSYKKKFSTQFLVSGMRKGAMKFLIDTKLIRDLFRNNLISFIKSKICDLKSCCFRI